MAEGASGTQPGGHDAAWGLQQVQLYLARYGGRGEDDRSALDDLMRRLTVIPDMEFAHVLEGVGIQHVNPAGKMANRWRLRRWLQELSLRPKPAVSPTLPAREEEASDGVPRVPEPESGPLGGMGDSLPPAV